MVIYLIIPRVHEHCEWGYECEWMWPSVASVSSYLSCTRYLVFIKFKRQWELNTFNDVTYVVTYSSEPQCLPQVILRLHVVSFLYYSLKKGCKFTLFWPRRCLSTRSKEWLWISYWTRNIIVTVQYTCRRCLWVVKKVGCPSFWFK